MHFYRSIRLNLREMRRGLRACRMLDVGFLEFPADTGQSDNGPKMDLLSWPVDGLFRHGGSVKLLGFASDPFNLFDLEPSLNSFLR